MLDLAFAADTGAWVLDSDGGWTHNGQAGHLQETLIAQQQPPTPLSARVALDRPVTHSM